MHLGTPLPGLDVPQLHERKWTGTNHDNQCSERGGHARTELNLHSQHPPCTTLTAS